MSFGAGLGDVAGKVVRIGHLGDMIEAMCLTALSVAEMALAKAGAQIRFGSGVGAAQNWYARVEVSETSSEAPQPARLTIAAE